MNHILIARSFFEKRLGCIIHPDLIAISKDHPDYDRHNAEYAGTLNLVQYFFNLSDSDLHALNDKHKHNLEVFGLNVRDHRFLSYEMVEILMDYQLAIRSVPTTVEPEPFIKLHQKWNAILDDIRKYNSTEPNQSFHSDIVLKYLTELPEIGQYQGKDLSCKQFTDLAPLLVGGTDWKMALAQTFGIHSSRFQQWGEKQAVPLWVYPQLYEYLGTISNNIEVVRDMVNHIKTSQPKFTGEDIKKIGWCLYGIGGIVTFAERLNITVNELAKCMEGEGRPMYFAATVEFLLEQRAAQITKARAILDPESLAA